MYIGLALMIPFLNLLWNGIGSRKGQLSLVAVMAALTVLPSIFNIYDFKTPGDSSDRGSPNPSLRSFRTGGKTSTPLHIIS